nr:lactosylceramide 4-alpha-galactosyltransferase-like [Quercus suber]
MQPYINWEQIANDRPLSRTAKNPIFSTISFAAILFLIYTDSIVSNLSITTTFDFETNEIIDAHETDHNNQEQPTLEFESTTLNTTAPLIPTQERVVEEEDSETQGPLIPPDNVSKEERLVWFRRKLSELEILKSNNLTRQFHSRVLEFFNSGCEEQFFMTWIAPARFFGREFFSLESLFKAHPTGCLMILSRSLDSRRGYRILKPVVDRGFKVNAVTPDLAFLFKNTPAEAWFKEMKSGNKDPGEIPIAQNLSNLVRLAVLYKYGGVYLDTDFIVLKPFRGLKNLIGAQSMDMKSKNWTRLNNAVLIFDANHPLLLKFIEEFASSFDGNKWGHNGPYLVSRVVERIRKKPGYNFTVLPPMAFYPVDWIRINRLFQKPANQGDSIWVQDKLLQLSGETSGVHLWNKHTSNLRIEEGSVMGRLILEHCILCQHIY